MLYFDRIDISKRIDINLIRQVHQKSVALLIVGIF